MKSETFTFKDGDGVNIFCYRWNKEDDKPRAAVQIAHGLSETAVRYERFAEYLTERGYIVYANDHRGHGRTAENLDNLGYAGRDGLNWMLRDMKQLNDIIKTESPGLPVFLFGHSMGSHLAQLYIPRYGNELRGVILSGTSGKQGFIIDFALFLSKRGIRKYGERARANDINKLSFGRFNKAFSPTRTEFDWLSRDNEEVDKYINDKYCGGVPTYGFYYDYFRGFKIMHKKKYMGKIPKDLPIFLFSGEKDPVGSNTKSVLNLIGLYKALQIKNISYKFYKDGRHEMLNEINRDEVMKDAADFFDNNL